MTTIYGGSGKFRGRHGKRDSMRAKAYAAERSTPMWGVMQWGSRATVEQCQVFVDKALARAWVRKRCGRRRVTVTDSGGKGGACASYGTIYVSTYYRNHLVLLHELAHCLTPNDVGHGREWARTYVQLVGSMMGADAGKHLRMAFRQHGVKTKQVTAAQRMAGRRLAAMAKERGDGGQALARHRAQRQADTAALLAAGWTKFGSKYWQHDATHRVLTRADALATLPERGEPGRPLAVVMATPEQQPEHDPYAPVWPEAWTPESRAEYLAAVYIEPAANDTTSGPYVPE